MAGDPDDEAQDKDQDQDQETSEFQGLSVGCLNMFLQLSNQIKREREEKKCLQSRNERLTDEIEAIDRRQRLNGHQGGQLPTREGSLKREIVYGCHCGHICGPSPEEEPVGAYCDPEENDDNLINADTREPLDEDLDWGTESGTGSISRIEGEQVPQDISDIELSPNSQLEANPLHECPSSDDPVALPLFSPLNSVEPNIEMETEFQDVLANDESSEHGMESVDCPEVPDPSHVVVDKEEAGLSHVEANGETGKPGDEVVDKLSEAGSSYGLIDASEPGSSNVLVTGGASHCHDREEVVASAEEEATGPSTPVIESMRRESSESLMQETRNTSFTGILSHKHLEPIEADHGHYHKRPRLGISPNQSSLPESSVNERVVAEPVQTSIRPNASSRTSASESNDDVIIISDDDIEQLLSDQEVEIITCKNCSQAITGKVNDNLFCDSCFLWLHYYCIPEKTFSRSGTDLCMFCTLLKKKFGRHEIVITVPVKEEEEEEEGEEDENRIYYWNLFFEQYNVKIGDYIYIKRDGAEDETDVFQVQFLFRSLQGPCIAGHYVYTPDEISQTDRGELFYPNEVFPVPDHCGFTRLSSMSGTCCVLSPDEFLSGRPLGLDRKHVYVSEHFYSRFDCVKKPKETNDKKYLCREPFTFEMFNKKLASFPRAYRPAPVSATRRKPRRRRVKDGWSPRSRPSKTRRSSGSTLKGLKFIAHVHQPEINDPECGHT